MSTRTLPGGTRRWITAGALAALLITTATACFGTWGVRDVVPRLRRLRLRRRRHHHRGRRDLARRRRRGARGRSSGPWRTPQLDPVTETGYIQFSGGVHTQGPPARRRPRCST